MPGEEDYGLVPLEANAAGRPAIAYGRGGALETIVPGVTGEHFALPAAASLADELLHFEAGRYDPAALRAHAESFAPDRFKVTFATLVEEIASGRLRPRPHRWVGHPAVVDCEHDLLFVARGLGRGVLEQSLSLEALRSLQAEAVLIVGTGALAEHRQTDEGHQPAGQAERQRT